MIEVNLHPAGEKAIVLLVVPQVAAVVLQAGTGRGLVHAPSELVSDLGGGGEHHPPPRRPEAPAEVGVLFIEEEALVHPVEHFPHSASNAKTGAGDDVTEREGRGLGQNVARRGWPAVRM